MKDCHMALSTGDDAGAGAGLTAWRNADAAYIAGELIPVDRLLAWNIKEPTEITRKIGTFTTSRVDERIPVGREEGVWSSTHAFQTVQFCYWLMQTVGTPTTEGTPAGYNTHALTIGATNVPDWHGIHFEREGITSNELRYDIMGLLPSRLEIDCGIRRNKGKAIQTINIPFSYLKSDASALAAQTPRSIIATGSAWKDWNHAITGNGAGKAPSGLTYNSNQLEVDIIGINIVLEREYSFESPDTNGYPRDGLMLGWKYTVKLDVIPIGDLLYTVNRTAHDSYAGDLDYDFKFVADATNDNIRFLFDKMYLVPFDEVNDWSKWFEGYTITLEPLDNTSSLTVTGIDNLDNTHFENP